MSNRTVYNVQYVIPLVNLSMPARQNRSHASVLRITPGMTEPIEFHMGNIDGVPINLTPFRVKFVVWKMNQNDIIYTSLSQSEVVFSKELEIQAPYEGRFTMVLTEDDTTKLARSGASTLRWSLFMLNEDGEVFPGQITASGARWGTLTIDLDSGIPISEIIRGLVP